MLQSSCGLGSIPVVRESEFKRFDQGFRPYELEVFVRGSLGERQCEKGRPKVGGFPEPLPSEAFAFKGSLGQQP